MSLWQALTGNSSQIDARAHDPGLAEHLLEKEELGPGFKLMRDYAVFTDRRIIVVNKQGMTGAKRSYTSYPYSRVLSFEVETKGTLDRDAEVRVHLQGAAAPLVLQIKDNATARDIGLVLAEFVLR